MFEWFERMGATGFPLLLCSVITLAVIFERLWFFAREGRVPEAKGLLAIEGSVREWLDASRGICPFVRSALGALVDNASRPRDLRDEMGGVSLDVYGRSLRAHQEWLALVTVVAPLLGLLGTVLGMISAFRELAAHDGPVHPSLLADGMWEAMLTTAAGLSIALPALVAGRLFAVWSSICVDRARHLMNAVNLALDGIFVASVNEAATSRIEPKEQVA